MKHQINYPGSSSKLVLRYCRTVSGWFGSFVASHCHWLVPSARKALFLPPQSKHCISGFQGDPCEPIQITARGCGANQGSLGRVLGLGDFMLVVLANCYKVKSCFRHYENCGVSGRLHRFGSVLEHVENHWPGLTWQSRRCLGSWMVPCLWWTRHTGNERKDTKGQRQLYCKYPKVIW